MSDTSPDVSQQQTQKTKSRRFFKYTDRVQAALVRLKPNGRIVYEHLLLHCRKPFDGDPARHIPPTRPEEVGIVRHDGHHMTNAQIGRATGIGRTHIAEALTDLYRDGLIDESGGGLRVLHASWLFGDSDADVEWATRSEEDMRRWVESHGGSWEWYTKRCLGPGVRESDGPDADGASENRTVEGGDRPEDGRGGSENRAPVASRLYETPETEPHSSVSGGETGEVDLRSSELAAVAPPVSENGGEGNGDDPTPDQRGGPDDGRVVSADPNGGSEEGVRHDTGSGSDRLDVDPLLLAIASRIQLWVGSCRLPHGAPPSHQTRRDILQTNQTLGELLGHDPYAVATLVVRAPLPWESWMLDVWDAVPSRSPYHGSVDEIQKRLIGLGRDIKILANRFETDVVPSPSTPPYDDPEVVAGIIGRIGAAIAAVPRSRMHEEFNRGLPEFFGIEQAEVTIAA
jgi:hypothetical protein